MIAENDILKIVTPDVRALVWVDDKSLNTKTPFFQTVDYLLDGLVRKHIDEPKEWTQVTFIHSVFGQSFWVAFADTNQTDLNAFVQSLKNIIPEQSRSKMVLLNHEKLPSSWNNPLDKLFGFVERI